MPESVLPVRLFAPALLSVCAALCLVVPAYAKPPAPGAPGAIHVWAPADKHGFGTAHELDSKAWFTFRQGSLSEVYYPDLSTPGFRGLQFAVSDGKGLLQRETVDDDPRHIEPLADGERAAYGRGPSREASEEAALRNWNAKFRDLDTREPE